jgi:hypothetical protein
MKWRMERRGESLSVAHASFEAWSPYQLAILAAFW